MKAASISLMFIIIILPFIYLQDMRVNYLAHLSTAKTQYDMKIETALDDGISNLIEADKNGHVVLHKNNAINGFYKSLYHNFGIQDNKIAQENLKQYIPIILIVDNDGFFILHFESKLIEGDEALIHQFSNKTYYLYEDNNYYYKFTLNDYLYVYNKKQFKIAEGFSMEVLDKLNDSSLNNSNYNEIKHNIIINTIEEKMNYYINNYNKVASQYGIEYEFWLPEIDSSTWLRTIKDISLMVIMQNYPYEGIGGRYDYLGVSGSRIKKGEVYE